MIDNERQSAVKSCFQLRCLPMRQFIAGKETEICSDKANMKAHLGLISRYSLGWSGGAVLGELPVLGRPTIWITVGQGPTALAVGAGWGLFGE